MKVYLIRPKRPATLEDLSEGLPWWKADALVAPLDLAQLTALTPPGIELLIADQQAGDPVDFEAAVDLAVVVAEAAQVPGLRYMSGRFKARGIPFVLGGPYVTQHPKQATFAAIRLQGALELVYPRLMADWLAGVRDKRRYKSADPAPLVGSAPPDWRHIRLERYRMGSLEINRAKETSLGTFEEVRYKPVSEVLKELEGLVSAGIRTVLLQSDALLAVPSEVETLLRGLAEFNQGRSDKVRFEARCDVDRLLSWSRPELLAEANVQRVILDLNAALPGRDHPENARNGGAAIDLLVARGIRVAGHVALFGPDDLPADFEAYAGMAREVAAIIWPRAQKIHPAEARYAALRKEARVVSRGRDYELRQDLFDGPNYKPLEGQVEHQVLALKELLLELNKAARVRRRLSGFLGAVRQEPGVRGKLELETLGALMRMLAGSLHNPTEHRLRLLASALKEAVGTRPSRALWGPGLEFFLEEVAIRSYVLKNAEERPLEAMIPKRSLRQHAIGLGTRLLGRFGAVSSEQEQGAT